MSARWIVKKKSEWILVIVGSVVGMAIMLSLITLATIAAAK